MTNTIKYTAAFFSLFFFMIFFSFDFFSSIGVSLFIFFGISFFSETGKKIEIKDIMILLAALQWIIGPLLAYKIFPDNDFYYMAVDIERYMSFVVPATFFFALGLHLPISKKRKSDDVYLFEIKKLIKKYKNLDLILIFTGVISELIKDIVPLSFRFVLFLFSGLRFIGLYFLFLSDRKNKMLYVYALLAWLFLSALKETMFHDLLLWLSFFLVIVAFITKPSFKKKLAFLILFLVLIVAIQTVKHSFRKAVSEGKGGSITLFTELVKKQVAESEYLTSESNLSAMVTRINQGWIIARIMYWTPYYEPYAKGETIKEALKASFLPRFLFPNKIKAGGRTYFTRFTGKDISDNTSMGLGLLGEAYANYGIFGGVVFMFIAGLFYNGFIAQIYKYAEKHPALIFFIPLIFLQVVKAEIDFSVILNHLIKSTVIVWFVFWSFNRFLNIKI